MTDDAPVLRSRMYGEDDLSSLPVFAGGFINFGFWPGLAADQPISVEQRVESQFALYRLVFEQLGVNAGDAVLEIGSGTGVGAAWAFAEFGPRELHGVDLSPDQVARASVHAQGERLTYRQGAAEDLPFPDETFDVAVSIEAAQHMDDLGPFAAQAFRVLRPGGRFAVSTFFAPTADRPGELAARLDTFASGVDRDHAVPDVVGALSTAGFGDVRVTSIGEHVWPGLDRWIAQLGVPEGEWPRRWLTSYRDGLIDYYVISAGRSAGERTM
ncbi:class I SAM-dependent methyltransferase [Actinokineospora xionganensis]|uniref:Methyltransferase domain-containing protein n=1 Tax=Actinokineospora xionganensis TaxID=2684470 RepID=A0ABR7L685_9PSEU|nr:class I SAM-dependent methyltransferase [Actinokineospora xionganensis]MBC6448199.1 methyltransferase domain-containing protein [Actinokineospora xionganensis]